jgi:hypothetical protein
VCREERRGLRRWCWWEVNEQQAHIGEVVCDDIEGGVSLWWCRVVQSGGSMVSSMVMGSALFRVVVVRGGASSSSWSNTRTPGRSV